VLNEDASMHLDSEDESWEDATCPNNLYQHSINEATYIEDNPRSHNAFPEVPSHVNLGPAHSKPMNSSNIKVASHRRKDNAAESRERRRKRSLVLQNEIRKEHLASRIMTHVKVERISTGASVVGASLAAAALCSIM
jgi:hypothetical protein